MKCLLKSSACCPVRQNRMAFHLLICSDVCGLKVNLEVQFDDPPSLGDVRRKAIDVFTAEALELQRTGALPRHAEVLDAESMQSVLAIDRIQVYDDSAHRWVELASAKQLHPYDQLYVYPKRRSHLDSSKTLPPPRLPSAQAQGQPQGQGRRDARASPTRVHTTTPSKKSAVPSARPNPPSDMVRKLFEFADYRQQDYLTLADFRKLFSDLRVTFNDAVIEEMFQVSRSAEADAGPSYLSFNGWSDWALRYPTVFACCFRRSQQMNQRQDKEQQLERCHDTVRDLHAREASLLQELSRIRADLQREEDEKTRLEDELHSLGGTGTSRADEEEQVVLDKEVRVQHQRIVLDQDERDLMEAAKRLDQRLHADSRQNESYDSDSSRRPAAVRRQTPVRK